jgi:hypothetical protein
MRLTYARSLIDGGRQRANRLEGRIRLGLYTGGYGAAASRRRSPHPGARRLVPILCGLPSVLSKPPSIFAGIRLADQCAAPRGLAQSDTDIHDDHDRELVVDR